MEEINKRLVEVDCILKKLDDEYINKIPQEVWDFITENKDENYVFKYDDNKTLAEQNLSIDTISILTYINMEYLLEEEAKRELLDLLKNDEITAEQKKRKKYNPDDLFKKQISLDNRNTAKDLSITEVKESVFNKLKNKIKKFLKILLS